MRSSDTLGALLLGKKFSDWNIWIHCSIFWFLIILVGLFCLMTRQEICSDQSTFQIFLQLARIFLDNSVVASFSDILVKRTMVIAAISPKDEIACTVFLLVDFIFWTLTMNKSIVVYLLKEFYFWHQVGTGIIVEICLYYVKGERHNRKVGLAVAYLLIFLWMDAWPRFSPIFLYYFWPFVGVGGYSM